MRVIVTAGGTQEPIDSVRSITNHATGRLGALIAGAFAALPAVREVVYVASRRAVRPEGEKIRFYPVDSTADLEYALLDLCRQGPPAAIIHGMAVSDYRVRRVTTLGEMACLTEEAPKERHYETLAGAAGLDIQGKLSSSVDDLVILLEKTPKVIARLRGLAPETVLVGFKLLDNVPHEELMTVAAQLLEENDCDFVLANDLRTVHSDTHEGYLRDKQGKTEHFLGKEAIAEGIAKTVLRTWEQSRPAGERT